MSSKINMNKIILTIVIGLAFMSGCSSTNFLGAKMYSSLQGFYVERWFLNPGYNKEKIPKATKFYGASANKIKHKFIVKYYIIKPNGDDIQEIPEQNMWKTIQDDYLYIKDFNNKLIQSEYAPGGKYDLELIPIERCIDSKWCKLYENSYGKELYIKKSSIKKVN